MLQRLLTISLALLANGWHGGPAHAADPAPRINCTAPHQRDLNLAPVGSGPLQLAQVYCQNILPRETNGLIVSPDGRLIAYMEADRILRIAPLDGSKPWTTYEMGPFERFSSEHRSIPAYKWAPGTPASNAQVLWTATQEQLRPSGFAKTPLQPATISGDGSIKQLPALRHDAGPLDGLLWVDGNGLALVQFGSRGMFYRPAHDDPKPSFAIIDAKRGAVLDTLAFDAIDILKQRKPGASPYHLVRNAAAAKLRNGKVRALLVVGQWVVWTERQKPRILTDPYPREFHNRMVMSPDGSKILIGRLLRTAGGSCQLTGGCKPGEPVEGVLAALHDLETGKLIWSIRASVTNDLEFPTPAISDDGRYALVGLVPTDRRPLIALVSMTNGQIVQTVPSPGGTYAMGFTRDDRVWTHAHGVTALYDVRAGAQ